MKSDIEIINEAGRILQDRTKRCRKAFALDAHGYVVEPADSSACQFCLIGAIDVASGSQPFPLVYDNSDGRSEHTAAYISGNKTIQVGGLSAYWDCALDEEQDACAQRMVDYK
jgi:hypothetical protein